MEKELIEQDWIVAWKYDRTSNIIITFVKVIYHKGLKLLRLTNENVFNRKRIIFLENSFFSLADKCSTRNTIIENE